MTLLQHVEFFNTNNKKKNERREKSEEEKVDGTEENYVVCFDVMVPRIVRACSVVIIFM